MLKFYHCNHTVTDMEKSVQFYEKYFNLEKARDLTVYDGNMRLCFMKDPYTDFRLELTWVSDHPEKYDLGCKEFHCAFYTDDFETVLEQHRQAGIVVKEELEHRLYFTEDPDGYQIEVVEMPQ